MVFVLIENGMKLKSNICSTLQILQGFENLAMIRTTTILEPQENFAQLSNFNFLLFIRYFNACHYCKIKEQKTYFGYFQHY